MARALPSRLNGRKAAPGLEAPLGLAAPYRRMASTACFAAAAVMLATAGSSCRPAPSPHDGQPDTKVPSSLPPSDGPRDADNDVDSDARLDAAARAILDAAATPAANDAGPVTAVADGDPMKPHRETREELLSLFSIRDFTEEEKKRIQPDAFLRSMFNVTGPQHANQGNKAIAQHSISREKCLEGLKDVVIQTPEQREKCGAENMVPVWIKGKEAWFCIDVFEFPNKACELPMVWTQPPLAKKVCELQGKRLCSDIEWNIACRGDPEGGPDQRYAYGDKLDLEICHTNLRHRQAVRPPDRRHDVEELHDRHRAERLVPEVPLTLRRLRSARQRRRGHDAPRRRSRRHPAQGQRLVLQRAREGAERARPRHHDEQERRVPRPLQLRLRDGTWSSSTARCT